MPSRKCDSCGKEKDVSGGKVCTKNSHFICSECVHGRGLGTLFGPSLSSCPLCHSPLR